MPKSSKDRARILIVDDEPGIRAVLHKILCESHECRAVSSAEEALSVLSAEKFDLVISDIRMSGMSGLKMIPQSHATQIIGWRERSFRRLLAHLVFAYG